MSRSGMFANHEAIRSALATRADVQRLASTFVADVLEKVEYAPQGRSWLRSLPSTRLLPAVAAILLGLALLGAFAAGAGPNRIPDGARIAFIGATVRWAGSPQLDDAGLYVVAPQGPPRLLIGVPASLHRMWESTNNFGTTFLRLSPVVRWSPGGDRVAYRLYGSDDAGIYVNELSGLVRKVASTATQTPVSPDSSFAWSPDGTRIAFISPETAVWPPGGVPNSNAYVVDVSSGSVRQLDSTAAGSIAWSPDGSRIAFGRNRAGGSLIVVASADGADVHELNATFSTANGMIAHVGPLSWSPDGTRIAYDREQFPGTDDGDVLMSVTADGTDIEQLSDLQRVGCCYHGAFGGILDWSPDGARVALASGTDDATPIIKIYATDGSRRLTTIEGAAFDWSTDGSQMVVAAPGTAIAGAPDGYQVSSLFIVDLETGKRSWIADGDYPDWASQ